MIFILLSLLTGCASSAPTEEMTKNAHAFLSNEEEVVALLRDGIGKHSKEITVRFRGRADVEKEVKAASADWVKRAFAETDSPKEGDYLRYQCGTVSTSVSVEPLDTGYSYTVTVVPLYYCYLFQEEEADALFSAWMAEVISEEELLNGTLSDYEKVRRIYNAVCKGVQYDKVHAGRSNNTLRSTAYSALHYHRATCQGFCVLLYRALRTAGVNCRIVSGTAGGVFHTWNIAEIDGAYYHLDATWDAGEEEALFFLKGTDSMEETHTMDDAFLSPSFQAAYTIAEADYVSQ